MQMSAVDDASAPTPAVAAPHTPAQMRAIAEVFKLLGDPTRIRILTVLDRHGELCVHEIAEHVAISETNVSQALRLLRTAGIVRNRRDGRHIHYHLDDDHVRTLLHVSADHVAHTS